MLPDNQQDNFKFIGEIGSGSYGRCILCERLADGSKVVLKKVELTEQAKVEAHLLNQISHQNVVTIYESYMSHRSLYMVLEHMAGGNLHELIKQREGKPLKDKHIVNLTTQLTSALSHIHEMRIVHRDVKPQNVLLSEDHRLLKLCDFGIAVQLEEGRKTKGSFSDVGTINYMAPEILEGHEYDQKADIWSLGCILYEMVEAKQAFPGCQQLAVFHKICQGKVAFPEHSKLIDLIKVMLTAAARIRPSAQEVLILLNNHQKRSSSLMDLLKKVSASQMAAATKLHSST